jgi:capsular polysaccharide transport system permease protein
MLIRKAETLPWLFAKQARVIWALMIREMHTRYGRENLGFLWVIGEPILFCAGVTIVWSAIRPAHEHGLPVPAFVATGYMPLTMWRHCVQRAVKAFESNGSLLFHQQVSPLDIITARVILEVFGSFLAGVVVISCGVAVGVMDLPKAYGPIYMGLFFQALFSYASALIIAALSEQSDVLEKFITVFTYLSLPLSGAFTMVDWLPPAAQRIVLWSPSVQNLEMIRGGQFGPTSHPIYNVLFDTQITVILLVIGMSLTLRVRRHLIIQ